MGANVRFCLQLEAPISLEDALKYGVKAEEWGFDAVGVNENLFWWEPGDPPVFDTFIFMTTILNRTKRIHVLTDVIDPVKRHPVVVAYMLSTLDNISKGRISVGIGAGEKANFGPLVDLGQGHPSAAGVEEFITVMRGVWESTSERPFNFEGAFFRVKDAFLSVKPFSKPNPRIYVGALGPRMRDLVARIAEGWIPVHYTPEAYEKDWKDIQRVARSAGRETGSIDPAVCLFTTVLRDGEEARRIASRIGRVRLLGRPQLLSDLGLPGLADDTLSIAKRPKRLTQAKRTDLLNTIPEELGRRITISGTPEEAIEQIERFIKAGVRLFALYPPFDEQSSVETVENYKNEVLPYFAEMEEREN
jgi:alkanesulfonate monooxygenase SsuD/methylene tetrahydromethanopterin reductase-like flavin-dependent oxidoreductase (luciferase family)